MSTPVTASFDAPRLEAALWLIGAPALIPLVAFVIGTAPLISPARPQIALACLVASAVGALLTWNLLWSLVARICLLPRIPAAASSAIARLVLACGTSGARRVVLRSSAGAMAGLGLMGAGVTGAWSAPADSPQPPSVARVDAIPGALAPHAHGAPDLGLGSPFEREPEEAPSRPPRSGEEAEEASAPTVLVRPGDTLWSLCADLLPAGASDERIAGAWPILHRANAETIGADPSLIHPGTTLVVPQELR
ncbi:LysM peptidoglycan-binding domain-containing protein [Actinomyces sp. B33]|uniref:LysM peptidoglycan-binding domain-containing protein n=1 Tax=Actinomyces sp. B33 TaxID=2942131 RepID=UPI00233FD39E|nr:LysM domain-containing protein [Actinomyces sp. B33]MDC4232680.1 LysM peptidoglycan-binding domain-containing protein [Actinomyces sp. B33]